jgi:alpha-amylase
MAARVRLILVLHNHQPIGNFDDVCERALVDSYAPFLDVLEEFPELPVVLHNSGSLFEWLEQQHPEHIARLRKLVERGQIELLGGPFYEPILSGLPRRDRIGQIRAYSQVLEQTFGVAIRGMWVPERVWEQAFASDLAEAGIEYTLLDDTHFRNAGLGDDELHGYYLTENDGQVVKVFAGSERLRYLIPFADPYHTVEYCRTIADRCPHPVLVFGDDGEKFGTWPGTKDLVYGQQWLRRFFQALREHQSWLKVTTLAEAVDHVSPLGTQYLPDASYREMTEWALPTEQQRHYRRLKEGLERQPDWPRIRPFFRAGSWRNFLVKYPEAREMYTRMLQVSHKLAEVADSSREPRHSTGRRIDDAHAWGGDVHLLAGRTGTTASPSLLSPAARRTLLSEARRRLYRAQCNCPYWHGAFGGLYLPHLRNAVYKELIQADTLLEQLAGNTARWLRIDAHDFNCDARKELCLASDRLAAYLAPGRGGHLYELDLRALAVNLLATLNRRPEPYHDRIRECAGQGQESATGGGVDPQGGIRFKQPDLDRKLQYDRWPRKSLVDHFLQPTLAFEEFANGIGHIGDFAQGVYQAVLRRSARRVEGRQWREGKLGPYAIRVTKTVAMSLDNTGILEISYELENLPAELPIHFGVEFNFAALAGGAPDRYFYDERGRQLGLLDAQQNLGRMSRLGLVDEWLGLDIALETSQPCGFWTMPIQTVSQSESGFELVHQSCAVVPHWEFIAPSDGRWSVQLTLSFDTSAAQARKLADCNPLISQQEVPAAGG